MLPYRDNIKVNTLVFSINEYFKVINLFSNVSVFIAIGISFSTSYYI
jgi:hypothetical protein